MRSSAPPWSESPVRAELLALYAEADALADGWTCACSTGSSAERQAPRCCHFGVTGREPYPTAVEIAEVRHAMRSAGIRVRDSSARARLPVVVGDDARAARPCPLLSAQGLCRIYPSRPFGCRTYFCPEAEGPGGPRSRPARDLASALGRRIADLSAQFDPRDPRPRPLTRALSEDPAGRQPRHNRKS